MAEKLLMVPGFTDGSVSFESLMEFLVQQDVYSRKHVFYIKYSSTDATTSFRDLASQLDTLYNSKFRNERIDIVCHGAEALVVRLWLAYRSLERRRRERKPDCPIHRLLMFAPANFGSTLAHLGSSFLKKNRSTFLTTRSYRKEWVDTGNNLLAELEPGHPLQWDTSETDAGLETCFSPDGPSKARCYPFVFAGAHQADPVRARAARQRKMEGTDGVVPVCGASLNTRTCRVAVFRGRVEVRWVRKKKFPAIPFRVFEEYDHKSLILTGFGPGEDKSLKTRYMHPTSGPGSTLLEALQVQDDTSFNNFANRLQTGTGQNPFKTRKESRNRYQQLYFRVRDNTGQEIPDFFIKFRVVDSKNAEIYHLSKWIDDNLAPKFFTPSQNASCRMVRLNLSHFGKLVHELNRTHARIMMEISAQSGTPHIRYKDASFPIYDSAVPQQNPGFLFPDVTTRVEVIFYRLPADNLLKIEP